MSLPLDQPDNYPWMPGSERNVLADLGELAVRLGSPVTYDRRGEVVWMDDFRYGLAPWRTGVIGTGAEVSIVANETDGSPYAMKLIGGSTEGNIVAIYKDYTKETLSRVGLEFSFIALTAFDLIYLDIIAKDGVTTQWGRVRLTYSTGTWAYIDSDSVYQDIASPGFLIEDVNAYHRVKLVIDLVENEYVHLLYDDNSYSLAGYSLVSWAEVLAPRYLMNLAMTSREGYNDIVQVGRCIITGNEP